MINWLFHGNMRLSTSVKFKPLCWSIWNFDGLIILARFPKLPSLVEILPLGVARHIREICAFLLISLFINFLPSSLYRLNGSINSEGSCLKQCGLTKGNAFNWGLIKKFSRDYPFPRIFKRHFTCNLNKSNDFWTVRDRRNVPTAGLYQSESRNRMVTAFSVYHAP